MSVEPAVAPVQAPAAVTGPKGQVASEATAPGLRRHTVVVDGHPIAVHAKRPARVRAAVVLIHGRTWSGVPDFDLQVPGADVSLMDALVAGGVAAYAVDLRGYGATPRDATGFVTPTRAAADVAEVLRFVAGDAGSKPVLLGWSLGALVAALTVQREPELARGAVFYGYPCAAGEPRAPRPDPAAPERASNTRASAASDFVDPTMVGRGVVEGFVAAAVKADPVRADWRGAAEWEQLRWSALAVPVLVIHGDKDPVTDVGCMGRRFAELRVDRGWQLLTGAGHAAHLERTAGRFAAAVLGFVAGIEVPLAAAAGNGDI